METALRLVTVERPVATRVRRRLQRVLELPLDYIHNPEFDRSRADRDILVRPPGRDEFAKLVRPPHDVPPYLASLYRIPLLTGSQERHLFRRYNYLKYRAACLRDELRGARRADRLLRDIERLYARAQRTRNQIVRANLRLVVALAKRRVRRSGELYGLISDGNMALIHAVEKFDYARGYKFSTYASRAIMRQFSRTIRGGVKRASSFHNNMDRALETVVDARASHRGQESVQEARRHEVTRLLTHLTDREKQVIVRRFGLDRGQPSQTLQSLGEEFGITKERVRQLERRAIYKLQALVLDFD